MGGGNCLGSDDERQVLLQDADHPGHPHLPAEPDHLRGEFRRQRDDRLSGGQRHLRRVRGGTAPAGAADVRGGHRGRHTDSGRPVLGEEGHGQHPESGVCGGEVRPGGGDPHHLVRRPVPRPDHRPVHRGGRGHSGGGRLLADRGLYLPVLLPHPGDDRRHAQRGDGEDRPLHLHDGLCGQRGPQLGADLRPPGISRPGGAGRGPGHPHRSDLGDHGGGGVRVRCRPQAAVRGAGPAAHRPPAFKGLYPLRPAHHRGAGGVGGELPGQHQDPGLLQRRGQSPRPASPACSTT